MPRPRRHSLAVLALAMLPPLAGGVALGALRQGGAELPLPAIVAAGPNATAAVLPDGTWRAELAQLYPGDSDPAVSPGGYRVAFVSERDGNPELYVADARTGETQRLTTNQRAADRRPAWSPDGRRIAWQTGLPGAADIYVMRADGSKKTRIVGGTADDAEPAWSPHGARIAFSSSRSGRRQLWAVGARGGEPVRLMEIPGRAWAPAWSPRGGTIAFSRERGGGADIWLLGVADGTTRQLTRGPGWDSRPDWSPGGRSVAFARATARGTSIWVARANGASAAQVEGSEGLADPDWAETYRALVPRPDERLPDLDQRAPAGLVVTKAGRRFNLGFASSTENHGVGPLMIRGVREGRSMRAEQVVLLRGGGDQVVRDVGRLHYEVHPPHRHWHLQSFVTYELRRVDDFEVLVRDRKSGFCLMDRWGRVAPEVPGSGPPRFVDDCGARQPRRSSVIQGTSVGYIDRYPAFFHGQDLNVTRLPAGRYVLTHRANPTRSMRELSYSNSSASLLVELAWPNGGKSAPRVTILQRCEGTERCPPR